MKSGDVRSSMTSNRGIEGRKPYVTPGCKRLSPEAAKELLLRHAEASNPEVQLMLHRIEELQLKTSP